MNIIGILIVTLCINTYGYAYYGFHEFPDWASNGNNKAQCGAAVVKAIVNATMVKNNTVF